MAILDGQLEWMDATSIAGAGAATISAAAYTDLGVAYNEWGTERTPDIGEGGALWVNARVATAIAGAGGSNPYATLNVYTHTASNIGSGTLLITKAISTAAAAGTTVLRQKLPAGTISRYLGCEVLIGATTLTAGALDVWVSLDSESELPSA